jgi:hypothetical protein
MGRAWPVRIHAFPVPVFVAVWMIAISQPSVPSTHVNPGRLWSVDVLCAFYPYHGGGGATRNAAARWWLCGIADGPGRRWLEGEAGVLLRLKVAEVRPQPRDVFEDQLVATIEHDHGVDVGQDLLGHEPDSAARAHVIPRAEFPRVSAPCTSGSDHR